MSNKMTSSVPRSSNIYLDCPYSEKDQAKLAGARWDESAKQWYVPPDLFSVIDQFNQWRPNGKIYLNCPFEQKDEAKKAGAKWDPMFKRWCVVVKERQAVIPAKFSKWLTKNNNQTTQSPAKKRKEAAKNSSSSSGDKRKRGNAQDAALLRVNDNMTVGQLQEECRFRKITGISGKNKDWLLQQLKSGTVWQSAISSSSSKLLKSSDEKISTNASAPAAKKAKKMASASTSPRKVTDKDTHKSAPLAAKMKVLVSKTTKSPIKTVKKVADKKDMKKEAATMTKSVASNPADLTRLPRVTSSLTVIQLTHELLHRHPNTKGISNKSKTWFLDELGEDSIWTTSPYISRDLSNASLVSKTMTVAQLQHELMTRSPSTHNKGMSNKSKADLVKLAGLGSIWMTASLQETGSKKKHNEPTIVSSTKKTTKEPTEVRGSARYMAKADVEAAALHCHQTHCHIHPLSDSAALRAPVAMFGLSTFKKRVEIASCDVEHHFTCRKTAYRTCERCDYDICKACYEIESLPPREKDQELNKRLDEALAKEAAMQRQRAHHQQVAEERHQQEEERFKREREEELNEMYGDDIKRFPDNVRNPKAVHKDEANKLKYTVWICDIHRKESKCDVSKDFNSSYATLQEANLRVEFVFNYNNPWGCDRGEMYADEDEELVGGFRLISKQPDGGGSLTVSALQSEVFDILEPPEQHRHITSYAGLYGIDGHGHHGRQQKEPRKKNQFSNSVRNPPAKHTGEHNKLKYTVWQSCGYGYDGWHSYEGPPEKTFNSSYATLKEANERAEYAFYYQNPWGLQGDELPYAETDKVSNQGFRFLECTPDDSECWTVSVVPSIAFDYINL